MMSNKGLNPFVERAADEYICALRKNSVFSSWGDNKTYTPGTIVNSQRMPTKVNKNGAIASKNFNGTNGTLRHLKTFRIITNEMAVLLLILCWWYFSCLLMYLEKCFNINFHELIFFQIFVTKEDTCQFFWEAITYEH